MRLAAIDIGTNSLHMIVVQVRPDRSFEVIDREKEMVRLGAGGLDGRALTPEAMHTALQVMSKFRRLAESHSVDKVVAVATSAVREAKNGGVTFKFYTDPGPAYTDLQSDNLDITDVLPSNALKTYETDFQDRNATKAVATNSTLNIPPCNPNFQGEAGKLRRDL